MEQQISNINRNNNFNLIRLFAALQVVLWHSGEHLLSRNIFKFLELFPGVPIFFVISGFLIYSSYERNNALKKYLKNRCLRIFPGLWSVFFFTIVILSLLGYIAPNLKDPKFWAWTLTQVTIFQFYTPEFLKSFGVGNPNGSLWTIFIEFSFYLFVPVLFLFKNKYGRLVFVLIFFVVSILFNYWYNINFKNSGQELSTLQKIMGVNLLPFLFYFLLGVLQRMYWDNIKLFFVNKGLYWLGFYFIYYLIFSVYLNKYEVSYWPNFYGFISTCLLSVAVISLAYSYCPKKEFLKGKDLSYGLYLYHMPLVNLALYFSLKDMPLVFLLVLLCTVLISYLSWIFIEKPALMLK